MQSTLTAQDKANILKSKWEKACHFTAGGLNTLAWKHPFPRGGTDKDYITVVNNNWMILANAGWMEKDIPTLMLGGESARQLLETEL